MTRASMGLLVAAAVVMAATGAMRAAVPIAQGRTSSPTAVAPHVVESPGQPPDAAFKDDVHARAGLTCASCHGGPKPGGGYATIARTAIAPLCAKCHADAAYMKTFAPQVRVDQYAQYQTSVHGRQMAKGETRVATCSDCHRAHGIVAVRDTRSPVAPTHVAQTCGRCHGDPARMTPFNRSPDIPGDWSKSVHADALLKRGDTSAPTCSTCHGSHGATPPGAESVANVCAQCHVREAELFKKSRKAELFRSMGQGDCLTCHSNHHIEPPQASWIGLDEKALCATCHDDTMPGAAAITTVRAGFDDLQGRMAAAREVLGRAETAGMLVEDGKLALHNAGEAHVRLRVLVHTFAAAPFDDVLKEGVAAANEARTVGTSAMSELQYRRRGLAVATLVILGFLGTLLVKIRRLPAT
ncbi:MAG TPA: cytochrome c3 family protein [Vicinamibacterales bacterium]|nr:cytochrome c3 family protein [Vicinamibacterales bacterium]